MKSALVKCYRVLCVKKTRGLPHSCCSLKDVSMPCTPVHYDSTAPSKPALTPNYVRAPCRPAFTTLVPPRPLVSVSPATPIYSHLYCHDLQTLLGTFPSKSFWSLEILLFTFCPHSGTQNILGKSFWLKWKYKILDSILLRWKSEHE